MFGKISGGYPLGPVWGSKFELDNKEQSEKKLVMETFKAWSSSL